MLRDILEFVAHPFPWHLAPMGYLRETSGIAHRANQCGGSWHAHLRRTRDLIECAAGQCPRKDAVLVVGSGLLLDVPLESLSHTFQRVILADVFHSRRVRHLMGQFHNVELVSADVTGIVGDVFRFARRGCKGDLPRSRVASSLAGDFDLVVSVNLLSQLTVIPRNYILAHCPAYPPYLLQAFGRQVVETHLAWLGRRAGRACLITDVTRREDRTGAEPIVKDILEGVSLPPPDETWSWHIAPRGTVFKDVDVVHDVAGYTDFRWPDGGDDRK